ncbi:hypothetical protein [Catelliglobosispora koreensis]|uniref:hypothetical protein n=1 Tax=Catelliglobosispora koreensis TaxID=129052 RepID=UPI00037075CB|nr:hypothetical protein [Catelliglobosispora koreensis]
MSAVIGPVNDRLNGWAADTDEVAAILESNGINDRVANRDYGHPSVFTLAQQVLAAVRKYRKVPAPAVIKMPVAQALVRAGLYLTPAIIASGSAGMLATLPWYATTGLLIAGWGSAQALAYLGYNAANETGSVTAARLLAIGFTLLATVWATLLAVAGAGVLSYVVSAAQIMLFAANTATLVTGTERRTLLAAAASWLAVLGILAGAGKVAVGFLLASIVAMVVVAYRSAWGPRASLRWQPGGSRLATAAGHGLAGGGQAILFVLVVLHHRASVVPLLIGIPLTELLLLWHQQRVANGRARIADRARFQRHIRRVARGTGAALFLPVIGAVVFMLLGEWPLMAATLLTGTNALCLILVAHRRPGSAISLVCLAGLLIAVGTFALPLLFAALATAGAKVCAAVLFLLYAPALLEAVSAMMDPWSYQ